MSDDTALSLPWPIPDSRAGVWAPQYEGMHAIVKELGIPEDMPAAPRSVMETARELIRHSYFRHEFAMVAVAVSIIAVEAALEERFGKGRLVELIKRAEQAGVLTETEADQLNAGRNIRNDFAHGKITHAAVSPAMAVGMVQASIRAITTVSDGGPHAEGALDQAR
jgi:hypothetical protein